MIYLNPLDNVRQIIRDVGTVSFDQLAVLFSDVITPQILFSYVAWLAKLGEVDYDQRNRRVYWHYAPELTEEMARRLMKAFWIVSYFGSKSVQSVSLMKPPFYLEVILAIDGATEAYDIAICNSTMEAAVAARQLQRMRIANTPDEVVHLVVVPDSDIGNKLDPYGFDSFVTLQSVNDASCGMVKFVPQFWQWGSQR